MLWMNWELTLLAMIPIPFMIIGTLFYRTRIHWVYHRIWRRISTLNSMLADSIPGVKVVKAFAQEHRELKRFDERNTDLRESQMASIKMRALFLPAIAFTTSVGSIILWWFGGNHVLSNTLTLGELQAFISYMMMFYSPVRALCTEAFCAVFSSSKNSVSSIYIGSLCEEFYTSAHIHVSKHPATRPHPEPLLSCCRGAERALPSCGARGG